MTAKELTRHREREGRGVNIAQKEEGKGPWRSNLCRDPKAGRRTYSRN